MDIFKHLKEYWVIYVFIAQLIIMGAWNSFQHTDYEKRITALEIYQQDNQIILTDIQTRLASIETNIVWLTNRFK